MNLSYQGTVRGWRKYGRKELLRAAFLGQSLTEDAAKIQRALDKAAAQDRILRILTQARTGGIA